MFSLFSLRWPKLPTNAQTSSARLIAIVLLATGFVSPVTVNAVQVPGPKLPDGFKSEMLYEVPKE